MNSKKALIIPTLLLSLSSLFSQKPFVTLPEHLSDPSYAEWITMPGIKGNEYGVYYFRKTLHLDNLPEDFIVHVSGDNRYRLFVNGKLVCWGPAAGDLYNWKYETINIAHALKSGKNVLAAQVWNMGENKGARQISHQTAFLLQGNSVEEQVANTNISWKVTEDEGYHPVAHTDRQVGGGFIAGGTDSLVFSDHPWNWYMPGFDDQQWQYAKALGKGNHSGLNTWFGTPWLLEPRTIPFMEQKAEPTPTILQVTGLKSAETKPRLPLQIPPHTTVEILLDNKQLTMGFPKIKFSGGQYALVKIQYQEALFDANNQKGNRNEWKSKYMKGYYDVFISDGASNRIFKPLWLRVFRYMKITVQTQEEEISLQEMHNVFTAYPFEQNGRFLTGNKEIDEIWDVSWHTVRLCALETYMDCPYYEQLQYIGDTRIQALISMYVAGDDRLAKNAIDQFYNSMQPMGLTKSSHPQSGVQIIPPFSLLYISMIHDYFMLRNDTTFIKSYLPGIRFILDWFVQRIGENGLLGSIPYWNHIDGGTAEFRAGSPPGVTEGKSAHMNILLAYTLQHAIEMFDYFGYTCDAENYKTIAQKLISETLAACYDESRGLIAETPDKILYSQHTNAMAILAGAFNFEQSQEVAKKMVEDNTLAQATLYFNFYVFQALKRAGLGGEILNLLDKWKTFLDYGFTTFPEHGINSRSDCHAWSSHPLFNFLNVTCGVTPATPGFRTVEIRPAPGDLTDFSGRVIHPLGNIECIYKMSENNTWNVDITLPDGLEGVFIWKEKEYTLYGKENNFKLASHSVFPCRKKTK